MSKCLLFIRTSTRRQETESQLKETKEYAEYLGYTEFVTVDKQGASAYGVTDEYLELIEEMKRKILSDSEIKCVVCWAMNRLFRNIRIADELKEWFVEHKIQLEIKEPHIRLLEPDGSLSNSSEMLFHFFSVYNKQQIDELKAKSHRAKVRDKALHKYLGARIPLGYTIKDKMLIPDPANAEIIKDLFTMYGSGEWSYTSIAREFNERYGTNYYDKHNIKSMLTNKHYYDGEMCPPIITKAEFDKATNVRKSCTSRPQGTRNIRFGAKLIECPVCGKHYTANVRDYRCVNDCNNKRISISNIDGLLWFIASHLEGDRMLKTDTKEELLQKKAVLTSKINGVEQLSVKGVKRAERAKKMALDGLLEIDEYKDILKQVEQENEEHNKRIEGYRTEIKDIDRLIEEDTMSMKKILEISDHIDQMSEEQMFVIVHRWIKRITFTEDWYFTIETLVRAYRVRYNRYGFPSRWFTVNGKALAVPQFKHSKDGSMIVPSKCGVNDIPITLAWLANSTIV